MNNHALTLQVFNFFKQAGVENVIVCAGARNAPLVVGLEKETFKVFNFFEERSAAFFALGLIKSYKKPVAVITTSGTAAAELLPAAIEAHYQGLPLLLVTADRPKSYRKTGSPQSIEQVGLFKNYVEHEHDLDKNTASFNFKWGYKSPLHLNVSFEEPLFDYSNITLPPVKIARTTFEHEVSLNKFSSARPLIILGELEPHHQDQVLEFIKGVKAPVYAESMSLLKHHPDIEPYVIKSSEQFVKEIFRLELCDSVIRIGGVPTLRFWRDLENEYNDAPVVNYTDLPFSGLSRQTMLIEIEMLKPFQNYPSEILAVIRRLDDKLQIEKTKLFKKYPLSEPAWVHQISKRTARDAVYLGNSLPIREWDQFADADSRSVYANRGANGIDGQVSTYLGWSENQDQSYCLVGDLTALYDLAALGLTPQLKVNKRFIMVMNNFGGQIFKRVFKNEKFLNAHKTQFYHWAKMWNWSYLQVAGREDFAKISTFNTPNVVVEIVPDQVQTDAFWEEWDLICQSV